MIQKILESKSIRKTILESDEANDWELEVASVPNPDHPSSPGPRIKKSKVKVSSYKDASDKAQKFIEDNMLGGGNWAGGDITDKDGKLVGRVSYNGRVWAGRYDSKKPSKLLYQPEY